MVSAYDRAFQKNTTYETPCMLMHAYQLNMYIDISTDAFPKTHQMSTYIQSIFAN